MQFTTDHIINIIRLAYSLKEIIHTFHPKSNPFYFVSLFYRKGIMMLKPKVTIFALLCILLLASFAKDSLFRELKQSDNPQDKAWVLNRIADYYLDIDLDSARYYADSAMQIGKREHDFRV